MKRIIALVVFAVVAAGILFSVFSTSTEDQLSSNLSEVIGLDGVVSLDGCNLSMTVESTGQENSPIALTRMVLQADLRNYDFNTVHFTAGPKSFGLRIGRSKVDERMLEQARQVIDAGGEKLKRFFSGDQIVRETFETDGGRIFFRVMAEVVSTGEGSQTLKPHGDAPDFFRFTEAVEAIDTPASYRTTTTFAGRGDRSAETFLTGEVVAVPQLQFRVKTEKQAKELAHAFNDYAAKNECH
ncbi:hypothetical protein [Shimia sp. R9_3]|uniref:hypothetical protein n=1 Tax=Shimia sp. R9_3 TaxID=2821113 RepID=UPI001ADB8D81|nr:hypothetical protein [Shimia sp. R9_3]MBO9401974.1 hypothetical protein [Shimia sp. R9_3]